MDAADIPSDAPRPRLCHLRKRPDFDGYGFNLHAEKGRTGQFVGKVDHGSPAELAGLREGDRIVEVNGVAVGAETHAQVVERVKAVPGETRFLVVDSVADEYYRDRGIAVRADMVGAHHHEASHHHDANGTGLQHRPRLCHLKIWPDFAGYGFNLHAEKDKAIQYIGKVDAGSPAAAAGLREHDRIVEVNGFNVSTESHHDVVKRIKSDPKQVTLLVVDQEADAHFKKEGTVPTGHFPSVERIVCPDQSHGHNKTEGENGKSSHHGSDEDDREIDDLADEIANIAKDAEKQDSFEHAEKKPDKTALSLNVTSASAHSSTSSSTTSPLDSPKSPVVVGGIEFAGTAEEARKKMSKKRNVKDTNMSVKAKYDLFQKL